MDKENLISDIKFRIRVIKKVMLEEQELEPTYDRRQFINELKIMLDDLIWFKNQLSKLN